MTREITITPVLNGFICKVGCQKVVFTSPEVLAAELVKYYKNPHATEKQWVANKLNETFDGPVCPQPVSTYEQAGADSLRRDIERHAQEAREQFNRPTQPDEPMNITGRPS